MIEHIIKEGKITTEHRTPMLTSRASFGSLYSAGRNEIFVAGGYEKGEIIKKCERYSVAEDKWYPLPDQNEPKCSQSLCLLENRYLYSIGGLSKIDANITLQTTIERLDLNTPGSTWQVIPIRLNDAACDIGCLPISTNEILIFGGWNKTPI